MTTYEQLSLALQLLILLGVGVDLYVGLRATRPIRRRKALGELGLWAAQVAEQKGGSNAEKARYARELVLHWGKHLKASGVEAEHVVEAAVRALPKG